MWQKDAKRYSWTPKSDGSRQVRDAGQSTDEVENGGIGLADRALKKKIFLALRIAVPLVLLTIILSQTDFSKLGRTLVGVRLPYFLASFILSYLSLPLMFAARWWVLLRQFYGIQAPYWALVRYTWIGMFVGYFVPSGVGLDVYRVMSAVKHGGGYSRHIVAIVGEKVLILVGSIILTLVTYAMIRPLVPAATNLRHSLDVIHLIGAAGLVVFLVLIPLARSGHALRLMTVIQSRVSATIQLVLRRAPGQDPGGAVAGIAQLVRPFLVWRNLLLIVAATIGMRSIVGIGGNLLFLSVGVDLPVFVNIFATTLMYLLFMIPISVGSLGVREGAFILIFGLFGVEPETALAASFLSLSGLWANTCLGGVIMLFSKSGTKATRHL